MLHFKVFCSHSPILFCIDRKVGRRTCHQHINSQCRCHTKGLVLEHCCCSTSYRGKTEAQSGDMSSLKQQNQREARSRPWGIMGSVPIQRASPPCSTPRHPNTLQPGTQTSGVTCSHIFHGLLPGWISPLGKAPGLFRIVRRTREEMTMVLLQRATGNSLTFDF